MTDDSLRSETTPERGTRTRDVGGTPATISAEILEVRLQAARAKREELRKLEELRELEEDIERLERGESAAPPDSPREESQAKFSELQPEKLPEYYGKNVREHRE